MHLPPSQLGCKSPSQIVPDHAAFDRQTKGYSCSVARFFETASKRARAHSRLFVVKNISVGAAIDYLLQSCAYWTIHRNQTMARTFAFRVHQKKPIRSLSVAKRRVFAPYGEWPARLPVKNEHRGNRDERLIEHVRVRPCTPSSLQNQNIALGVHRNR